MKAFITFEGIEGCGKTTQIGMIGDHLAGSGIPVLVTEEPGGTELGRYIRRLLLNRGECRIDAKAELLLFASARAQHVQDVILPALTAGRVVLCDRFFDATLAYQGYGRGLDPEFIKSLNDFCTAELTPDLTILFDLPVGTGLGRANERIARLDGFAREDRFEQEDMAFHQRIRDGYLSLAREHAGRFRIVDATRDIQSIQMDIRDLINALIQS